MPNVDEAQKQQNSLNEEIYTIKRFMKARRKIIDYISLPLRIFQYWMKIFILVVSMAMSRCSNIRPHPSFVSLKY